MPQTGQMTASDRKVGAVPIGHIGCRTSAARRLPDAALLHQGNLPFDDLTLVFLVLAGAALQVQVLRIDGLFVDELGQLGAHVLQPIARLCM